MAHFGDRIRLARLARGMTQAQLANAAGIAMMSVSNYERGVVKNPHGDNAKALAKVLQVDVGELLGDSAEDTLEELPGEQDEDVRWAAEHAELDGVGLRKLRAVRREIGPMTRAELHMAAGLIAKNRTTPRA